MKPHGVGTVWFARDGRIAVVDSDSDLNVLVLKPHDNDHDWFDYTSPNLEGDWIKVDRPEFPAKLPPKPRLYQCYTRYVDEDKPSWKIICDTLGGHYLRSHHVVPHPDNDPEAVAMIEGRA